MHPESTPGFNQTTNQEEVINSDKHIPQLLEKDFDDERKLVNFNVAEIDFNEEAMAHRIKNLVNREYPQPFPLKSQVPETFTSEFIMTPINITAVHR